MRKIFQLCFACLSISVVAARLNAQVTSAPEPPRPLVLTEAIPMAGVQGRFDHFGFDGKNQLIVAALGNNTVEVIDISARLRVHTVTGIPNPQGVVYAPESKKLFAASSKGKLYIYDGRTFDLVKSIDFEGDVDDLRYDAANHRIYVGYGEDETGAIGAVDASTNERLAEEYKLGAHPESFQLETAGPNIYVNLPDLKQIAVINRKTRTIIRWPVTLEHNFPMALDEADHCLFVATHQPPRLAVFIRILATLWSRFPAFRMPTTCTMTRAGSESMCRGEKGLSASFNKRMQIITVPWPKCPRLLEHGRLAILARAGRVLTASSLRFPPGRIMARRFGSTP